MLDLSPEKVMVLLAVGLVVLSPNKLPAAARSLAHGLARARRLASNLTDPIATTVLDPIKTNLDELTMPLKSDLGEPLRAGLAEPRQAFGNAVADLRSAIAGHPLPAATPASLPSDPVDPSVN